MDFIMSEDECSASTLAGSNARLIDFEWLVWSIMVAVSQHRIQHENARVHEVESWLGPNTLSLRILHILHVGIASKPTLQKCKPYTKAF